MPQALEAAGYDLGWVYAELAQKAIADHQRLRFGAGSLVRGAAVALPSVLTSGSSLRT